jgi:hypothetical protein
MAVPPFISDATGPFGRVALERRAINLNSPTVGSAEAKVPTYMVFTPTLRFDQYSDLFCRKKKEYTGLDHVVMGL